MYCVSVNISSDEWVRIYKAAREQWPGELLSRSEILRRYIVIGIGKLKNVSPEDAKLCEANGVRASEIDGGAGYAAKELAAKQSPFAVFSAPSLFGWHL